MAPASKPSPEGIHRGLKRIEEMGFKVVIGDCVRKSRRHGFLAASDEERADELNGMFRRDDVDAIFCSQGGYGSLRILELIDYGAIQDHPKIILGMSDITSLLLAVHKMTGMVTFHGPSICGPRLSPFSRDAISNTVMCGKDMPRLENPLDGPFIHTVNEGKAEGELIGGNLNLIVATIGTRYEIETAGKLFFFEVPQLRPWQIDRHLVHLRLASKMQTATGFVAGEMVVSNPHERALGEFGLSYPGEILSHHFSSTVEEVINENLSQYPRPAIYGLCCGHGSNQVVVPLGAKATLDASEGRLELSELPIASG